MITPLVGAGTALYSALFKDCQSSIASRVCIYCQFATYRLSFCSVCIHHVINHFAIVLHFATCIEPLMIIGTILLSCFRLYIQHDTHLDHNATLWLIIIMTPFPVWLSIQLQIEIQEMADIKRQRAVSSSVEKYEYYCLIALTP